MKENYYDRLTPQAQEIAPYIEELLKGLSIQEMINLLSDVKEKLLKENTIH